jgi:hypothetical protein
MKAVAVVFVVFVVFVVASGPACVSPASAQGILYRCQGPDGVTVFQDEPCPDDAVQRSATAFTPDPEPDAAARRASEAMAARQRERIRRHAGTAWISTPAAGSRRRGAVADAGSRAHRRAACRAAREARDAYQFQRSARANDAQMARHRARVQQLCHGF